MMKTRLKDRAAAAAARGRRRREVSADDRAQGDAADEAPHKNPAVQSEMNLGRNA